MPTLTRLLLLPASIGLTLACASAPTVAVNPISGTVHWTTGDTLWSCDGSGENCTKGRITVEPTDTSITTDSRFVFAKAGSVYICNDEGQACIEVALPGVMKAADLSVSPSGEIFVTGSNGSLARCNETECRAVSNPATPKPSAPESDSK